MRQQGKITDADKKEIELFKKFLQCNDYNKVYGEPKCTTNPKNKNPKM